VSELPIVKPRVIEHQVHSIDCPCCGQRNRGELPPEGARRWLGPNVISRVGLVMGRYRLSKRQVTHLLAECFGITMAASTVVNQQQVISQALAAPVVELEPVVQTEPICNIDETSWRQVGAAKRPWLWAVVTAQVTLFRIASSRSSQVARALLGEPYGGGSWYRPLQFVHLAGTTPVVLESLAAGLPEDSRTRRRFVSRGLVFESPGRIPVDEMGACA
jgi:transposase